MKHKYTYVTHCDPVRPVAKPHRAHVNTNATQPIQRHISLPGRAAIAPISPVASCPADCMHTRSLRHLHLTLILNREFWKHFSDRTRGIPQVTLGLYNHGMLILFLPHTPLFLGFFRYCLPLKSSTFCPSKCSLEEWLYRAIRKSCCWRGDVWRKRRTSRQHF